jgi:quercetin dioxygenase-like cupin family protein
MLALKATGFAMRVLVLAGASFLLLSGTALSQVSHSTSLNPGNMKWEPAPASLPKGAEAAVLSGNPTQPGSVTIRLKMPAGYKVPAHNHPTAEEVTVISGTFHVGTGDKLDEQKAETLGAGGFVSLPANMNHFAFATSDAVVQINTQGPLAIRYVNPADDPSRTQ